MITDTYTRKMVYTEFISRVMVATAEKIMVEQAARVDVYYNMRSGDIVHALESQIAKVSNSGSTTNMEIGYLLDLRFLDMKHNRYGRKKVYGPVYNKPLWGFVYGYMFGTLRYGLITNVQRNILDEIRESYKKSL